MEGSGVEMGGVEWSGEGKGKGRWRACSDGEGKGRRIELWLGEVGWAGVEVVVGVIVMR